MLGRRFLFAALASCVALLAFATFARRPEHAFLVANGGAELDHSALLLEIERWSAQSRDDRTSSRG